MKDSSLPLARRVLSQQADALNMLAARLDSAFDEALACLLNIEGRIAVTGMGKSGHVAAKVAATLASTGAPAYFIHPAEASHGDLGMMSVRDAVLAFSNSGETVELSDIVLFAARARHARGGRNQERAKFFGPPRRSRVAAARRARGLAP